MKRMMVLAAGLLLSGGVCVAANADDAQVNEAAVAFDGVKGAPPVNSGNGVIRLKLGGLRLWL